MDERLRVREGRADRPPARELLAAYLAELSRTLGGLDLARTPSASADEMTPPDGAFLVLVDEKGAVACGGLKRLDAGTAEVKRMYVVPGRRGEGHGRRLLAELERRAAELGYSRVRLDTARPMAAARALYESAGYRAIGDYNGNAYAAHWFEKELAAE